MDYLQYIDEAATPVMFDVMIEFDEDHKRVAINIEVAKEKIANKKCRLLKVPLFNNEMEKFHVPYIILKKQIQK